MLLPPEFRADTAPPAYAHGGARWLGGEWYYEQITGSWGWTSFGDGARCILRLAGHDAMYQRDVREGRQSEVVWLPDTASRSVGSVLYGVRGPADAAPLLARVIQTYRAPVELRPPERRPPD